MSAIDLLYRVAVWDTQRARREREQRDFLPSANARIQRGIAEAWKRGDLNGAAAPAAAREERA